MVGMEARMRVSSPMTLSARGTLRSQRTSTFLPLRSASLRSPTESFFTTAVSAAICIGAEALVDAVKPAQHVKTAAAKEVLSNLARWKTSTHAFSSSG